MESKLFENFTLEDGFARNISVASVLKAGYSINRNILPIVLPEKESPISTWANEIGS
jgi:hypothetical protein